jgi:hypothetical protein
MMAGSTVCAANDGAASAPMTSAAMTALAENLIGDPSTASLYFTDPTPEHTSRNDDMHALLRIEALARRLAGEVS